MKIAKFEFSLFGINTYVVWDPATKECAVIDPGMINDEEREALDRFISREGLAVKHIINTHLHVDHAIGNAYAKRIFDAPVEAHEADEPLGKALASQGESFGLAERIENVSVNTYLRDGDAVRIGDGELKVLHVPGHSPGSIALYDAEGGYVISGDALFQGSIGRTDLPGGDMDTLLKSIREKLFALPDETIVFPGHGPATKISYEKSSNPFFRR